MTCESCKTAGRTSAHAQSELRDGLCVECWKQRAEAAERTTMLEYNRTCIHHNDYERTTLLAHKCPICTLARAEAAEKAAAEMRQYLYEHNLPIASNDLGSNYLSPEQVKEQVYPLLKALISLRDGSPFMFVNRDEAIAYAKAKGWV